MLNPLAGFLVGMVVGFTGVGGGALMTPLLVLLFGIAPQTAVGTDLLFASHDILDQPTAPKVTQAAGPIWDLVVAGQLKVKDALDQIAAAIDPIIAENRG